MILLWATRGSMKSLAVCANHAAFVSGDCRSSRAWCRPSCVVYAVTIQPTYSKRRPTFYQYLDTKDSNRQKVSWWRFIRLSCFEQVSISCRRLTALREAYNSHAKCGPRTCLQRCELYTTYVLQTDDGRRLHWFIDSSHSWLVAVTKF